MTLSDRERRVLDALEQQLAQATNPIGLWRGLHLRLGFWGDRIGWLCLIGGFALVVLLLPISVLASFGAFLASAAGLGLVLTGRTGLRAADLTARLQRRPPDKPMKGPTT